MIEEVELKPLPIIRGKPLIKLTVGRNYIIRELEPSNTYRYERFELQQYVKFYECPAYYQTKHEYLGIKFIKTHSSKGDIMVEFQSIQRLPGDSKPFTQKQYFDVKTTHFFEVNRSQDIGVDIGTPISIQVARPDNSLCPMHYAHAEGGRRTKKNCQKKQTKYKKDRFKKLKR